MRRWVMVLLLVARVAAGVSAEDRVFIGPPLVSPDGAGPKAQVMKILDRAVYAANRNAAFGLHVSYGQATQTGDFMVNVVASDDGQNRALVLSLTQVGNSSIDESYPFLSPWVGDFGRDVAQAMEYLVAQAHGFPQAASEAAPHYVDRLTSRMLSSADLPYSVELRPYSVASLSGGNIIVGTAIAAIELDPLYRELSKPGRSLLDQGVSSYAYQVFSTRAGTLVTRSTTGGDLFVIHADQTRVPRLRTGIDQPSAIAVLDDGSIVVVDSIRHRAERITGGKISPLPIFPYNSLFLSAISAGPDDTLWVWDPVEGRIRIYTASGEQIDSVIPMVGKELRSGIKGLQALPDGSFVLLGQNLLARFDRRGNPIWQLDSLPSAEGGGFTYINSFDYDSSTGFIYLVNISTGEMVRLLDPSPPRGANPPDALTKEIVALNERLLNDPSQPAIYRDKASLYEKAGAYELADTALQHLLDLSPNDASAQGDANRIEALILKERARRAAARAERLLNE
ncbi:MAG TPA: hypothetical protein VMW69_11000, partial [Spirochaetia bacterium]|nr:hypothetical protein [Spirochaetia bacterium]